MVYLLTTSHWSSELTTEQLERPSSNRELPCGTHQPDYSDARVQTGTELMLPKNIVWTSVISALAAVAAVIAAVLDSNNFVVAFSAIAITSAILAGREK
jgi:hypothetical protein